MEQQGPLVGPAVARAGSSIQRESVLPGSSSNPPGAAAGAALQSLTAAQGQGQGRAVQAVIASPGTLTASKRIPDTAVQPKLSQDSNEAKCLESTGAAAAAERAAAGAAAAVAAGAAAALAGAAGGDGELQSHGVAEVAATAAAPPPPPPAAAAAAAPAPVAAASASATAAAGGVTGGAADVRALCEDSLSCPVCRDLLLASHTLKCGHIYCGLCLAQWLAKNPVCPICREDVRGEQREQQHGRPDMARTAC